MLCDDLDQKIHDLGCTVEEYSIRGSTEALTIEDTIILSTRLDTEAKRNSVKIHEVGHFLSCPCNVLQLPPAEQERLEYRADRAGILEFITLDKLLEAHKKGCRTCWDFCDYLQITEPFFIKTLMVYSRTYGLKKEYNGWIFIFDPLHIKKQHKRESQGYL